MSAHTQLKNPFRRFYREYSEFRRFSSLKRELRDIVFYAESESYWPYFGPVIEWLTQNLGQTVCYLTSSPTDPCLDLDDERIRAFYIGDATVRTALFAGLDAGVMVMTIPEFGSTYLKRSPHPVHYVYLPHNMTSTHMIFNRRAFNSYDTIFCVGPHQASELLEAEKIYGLNHRNLIEGGYVRLDGLYRKAQSVPPLKYENDLQVMVAPTWGPSGLLANGCQLLIKNLLEAGYRVVLRPHRDSLVKDAVALQAIRTAFNNHSFFRILDDKLFDSELNESHLMVSDWSGAALSFAFAYERPVLFVDVPAKVTNTDFSRFTTVPLEVSIRPDIGQVLAPNEMHRASQVLELMCAKHDRYRGKIQQMRSQYVFRLGDCAAFTATQLVGLADQQRKR